MNYGASFPSSSSDNEKSDSSEEDNEVDETLVRELRESLHFCVGKICRAEELAAANEVGENNEDDSEECDGMSTLSSTKKTRTVMSKEAIGALTELVYHYSTSSLANDLCAFSNHANRRTVKADDVLLVARKEKHILAELKRKIKAEQPTTTASAATGRKTKKNAANNNKSRKTSSSSKSPLFNSGKKKKSMLLGSSSSSSSNSDSDSDIDPMERIRQRRLELRQKNLNNTAFGCNNNNNNDDSSNSSSSSDGLELNATSGKDKKKQSSNPKRSVDAQNDDMVIDLQDSE